MILKMAYETEEKTLNADLVQKAIERLLIHPSYGHYFFIIDTNLRKFCGMNLVTFEHNINHDSTILWIQSVFVNENYRMKGLFRKLLYKNEDYILENKNFKKIVKLYMEKENTKAEQVYFKVGFKISKEILYEIDYYFDDISELKSDHSHIVKENLNIQILGLKTDEDVFDLKDAFLPSNFNDYVFDIKKDNENIKNIFGNKKENSCVLPEMVVLESLINENEINLIEEKEKLNKVF